MKKFALVSDGRLAAEHAKNSKRVGELIALCVSGDENKPDHAAGIPASHIYQSIDELLAHEPEVDVVVVCSPTGHHAEQIIKSLQARKHVVCESPLCLTTAAAWQIMETEKFCRRKVVMAKPWRYNPVLQSLKNAMQEEVLGPVYSFQLHCFCQPAENTTGSGRGKLFPDGGTLYSHFSPFVDTMLWLFGEVSEAKGFAVNAAHQNSFEFEDTGAVALKMTNGTVGTFNWSVNAFGPEQETALTVLAEKGTVRLGGRNLHEVQHVHADVDLVHPALKTSAALETFHQQFYDEIPAVLDSNSHQAGACEGLKTVETIEKIYKAIRE